jgi:hypothetical protein
LDEVVMVFLSVTFVSSIVGALAYPSFAVRCWKDLRGWASGLFGRARERARLRTAAALLDLGNHLMLCDQERKARRLERRLSGRRARRFGLEAAALRLGAKQTDEITLELPIGSREQEGNPSRTLAISCVVHHLPPGERPTAQDGDCALSWRVANRPSPGYRGPSAMCEMPSLERALLAYHARPLRPLRQGGRFFDEGVHHGAGKPEATSGPAISRRTGGGGGRP